MCDFNAKHAAQLARIEEKLDTIQPLVTDHAVRISKLEMWRSWAVGSVTAFGASIATYLRYGNHSS